MKLLEKFRNMFTEQSDGVDEEDDIIVEKIQNDVTHVPIESPKQKNNLEEKVEKFEFEDNEKPIKPVFFDEKDFEDLNNKSTKENILKDDLYKEKTSAKENNKHFDKSNENNYKEPKENVYKETKEKKIFKPTPIISPVYGILDKNYHKEDIVSRPTTKTDEKNNVEPTVDAIRNKAYGTLEDELENTLFGSNSILFKNNFKDEDEPKENDQQTKEVNEDILSNLTDDIGKELDELLIKKEKYSNPEVKKTINNNLNDEDLLGFIDSTLYKGDDVDD